MLWFLRLFNTFKEMEDEYASLSATLRAVTEHNSKLDSLCQSYLDQRDRVMGDLLKLQEDSARNLKLVANWQAVMAGSLRVPFPDVHVEPVQPPMQSEPTFQPAPTFRTPRDIQQDLVNASRNKAFEARRKFQQEHVDQLGLGAV